MPNNTITRSDLSDAVHQEVGLGRQESTRLVETFLDLISEELVASKSVKLSSFGSFLLRDKTGRVGRNPKTGQEVPIKPRKVLIFKPSQILRGRVDKALSD